MNLEADCEAAVRFFRLDGMVNLGVGRAVQPGLLDATLERPAVVGIYLGQAFRGREQWLNTKRAGKLDQMCDVESIVALHLLQLAPVLFHLCATQRQFAAADTAEYLFLRSGSTRSTTSKQLALGAKATCVFKFLFSIERGTKCKTQI